MGLNARTLAHLRTFLSDRDVKRIENNARIAETIERRWLVKTDGLFAGIIDRTLDTVERTGELPRFDWMQDLIGAHLLEHELESTLAAIKTVTPAEYVRARAPRWPTDIAKIRVMWDRWKKNGRLPGRTQKQAAAIKILYIRRIQAMWQARGRQFIEGAPKVVDYAGTDVNKVNTETEEGVVWNPDAFDREAARRAFEKEAKVSRSRARTIVETETTRYYNSARVSIYSAIETVVGYLFVAVRDHATTKWCRSRNGVVFAKGTPLMKKNTPPCHYNCRSEFLPLSRLNPAHRKLLEDASKRAENVKLVPLLPGWNT